MLNILSKKISSSRKTDQNISKHANIKAVTSRYDIAPRLPWLPVGEAGEKTLSPWLRVCPYWICTRRDEPILLMGEVWWSRDRSTLARGDVWGSCDGEERGEVGGGGGADFGGGVRGGDLSGAFTGCNKEKTTITSLTLVTDRQT